MRMMMMMMMIMMMMMMMMMMMGIVEGQFGLQNGHGSTNKKS